ncbi:MAG: NFACT family protein [Lachnospiraceae bacterium]|nr:NFACT family protein [Lachnospiraceae bacterium]
MAFDGILIHSIVSGLSQALTNGRLNQIRQPEKDVLELKFRTDEGNLRLMISVKPSLPLVSFLDESQETPMTAPNFCMAMRKHLGNAKLREIIEPGLERVIIFRFDHLDEMGDLKEKRLHVELMGKYSNIILTDSDDRVIDAIKRVPPTMSSVRTVLPGSLYFIPETNGKTDPFSVSFHEFCSLLENEPLSGSLSHCFTGFSESASSEFIHRESFKPDVLFSSLDSAEKERFYDRFRAFLDDISNDRYRFEIAFSGDKPVQFSAMGLPSYHDSDKYRVESYPDVFSLLREFYGKRAESESKKQYADDLKRRIKAILEKDVKKLDLQRKQLEETKTRETNRLFGELLQAYAFSLPSGEPVVTVENYYDNNKPISIHVDPDLSVKDNARRYFDKYAKQKRTEEALIVQTRETEEEIDHLRSVLLSIDLAEKPEDYREIRRELSDVGLIKNTSKGGAKIRKSAPSKPLVYESSDGYLMLFGRNNLQNDFLTMKQAQPDDYFFHAKKLPGSHVILRTEGRDVPDRTFAEAAALAAFYSSGKDAPKVEIDYVQRKHVKKPAGAKPGFVVYYTNYSMMASPVIDGLKRIS